MKITDYKTSISEYFLSALVNGDYSGLSDGDELLIDNFMNDNGYADVLMPDDTEASFMVCEICNLYSNCVEVQFYLK